MHWHWNLILCRRRNGLHCEEEEGGWGREMGTLFLEILPATEDLDGKKNDRWCRILERNGAGLDSSDRQKNVLEEVKHPTLPVALPCGCDEIFFEHRTVFVPGCSLFCQSRYYIGWNQPLLPAHFVEKNEWVNNFQSKGRDANQPYLNH